MLHYSRPTLNIAHRGASSLAPENTLEAGQQALESGADMWEVDVNITVDGVFIALHDDSLDRTSNVAEYFPYRHPWYASAFSLREVSRLDFGYWFRNADPFEQVAAGAVSEEMLRRYEGASAPTLTQALMFTKENDWLINIDLKDFAGSPAHITAAERVVDMVEELNMVDQVVIASLNHGYLRRVRAANPGIATAAKVNYPVADPLALVRHLDVQVYQARLDTLEPHLIPHLREHGVDVYVWAVDEEAAMYQFVQYQASGISTNFPQRLRQVLAQPPEAVLVA